MYWALVWTKKGARPSLKGLLWPLLNRVSSEEDTGQNMDRGTEIQKHSVHTNYIFKRKNWTRTGIWTTDLQITSLALLTIDLSKFSLQSIFKCSSWNDRYQTPSLLTCKGLKYTGHMVCDTVIYWPIVKSARLEIWRSVVQIPVLVQIFLLKI